MALILCSAAALAAEPKIALVGPLPEEKSVETLAAQKAIEANNALAGAPHLKLAIFNTGTDALSATAAAQRAAADPDVVAVVVHGEDAASPEALNVFKQAGLAVVAASAWSRTRSAEAGGVTWLSPGLLDLAETAAVYARREAKSAQAAVVDDGSPTSVAAARAFAARYRALGGKIPFDATWRADDEGLAATVKGLTAHWPQMVFYSGDAATAGALVLAMKGEKALKNADLIGLPLLFDPAFFNTTRLKGLRTRALFPCPDYDGMGALVRNLGFTFPKTSNEYKAYVSYANRKPGRWTSMIFDGVALALRAVRTASAPAVQAAPVAAAAGLSPSAAESLTPAATATVQAEALAAGAAPTRDAVRKALLGLDGYRGIRGNVKFSASREPVEPKAMVYFAMNRVGKKEMLWKQKAYGPPF